MKNFISWLTIVLALSTCTLYGQSAAKQQDASYSPYWREHRSELRLDKNVVPVPTGELPSKLQQTFENNELYKGWESSPLYFDKNTSLYNLYIKRDSTITVYGFNDRGKAVTYNSYTVHEE